ncbi:MAG: hypothetical protein GWN86_07080 [Desulfobacterales bacterium]|nr:hypothetical protein [Desulfobacterales bacterium]
MIIDMTNPETRKVARVLSGYHALAFEVKTGLRHKLPILKVMQKEGFKSKRKRAMLCELYDWLNQWENIPIATCRGCGGDNHD